MKQLIARSFKILWRGTSSVRRPLMVRFDARVDRLAVGKVEDRMRPLMEALDVSGRRLERVEASLARADRAASRMTEEVDLVLNGLSREIFRLQARVEMLQRALGEAGEGAPLPQTLVAAERPGVG